MITDHIDTLPVLKDFNKIDGNTRISISELAMISYRTSADHTRQEMVGVLGTNGRTPDGRPPSVLYVGEPWIDNLGLHVHKSQSTEIQTNAMETYRILEIKYQRPFR